MRPFELKKTLRLLPAHQSGIYIFRNTENKPLYIGKASDLKNRVNSYAKTTDPRLIKMLSEANSLDYIETDSDIEALLLESQYIKKLQPQFNIMLRDDKQYGFVVFTKEKYPKIFITHQPTSSQTNIGSFTDIGALKTTLRLLRKIFPYCTCKQLHNNYCLNYHIEKCLGFCCLKDSPERNRRIANDKSLYKKNIKAIKDILSGKKSSLIKNLEKEMDKLGKKQKFEEAIGLKNKIEKLKRVFQNAQIIHDSKFPGLAKAEPRAGIIQNSRHERESKNIMEQLAQIIGTDRIPHRIEAYDIANIQGKHAVGAMTVFVDGHPDKGQYRKFKIYTKDSPNDTAMLHEVLTRRFNHLEWKQPDLIIVDGGRGQLNTAIRVVRSIRNSQSVIDIIGLTKNEKHIGHKIILKKGKEISLSRLPFQIKNLLLHIDSEVHRFAISYYRKLHRKKALRPFE